MNLAQIRFVRAVAQSSSFSQAARQCHISQPSLSTAVAQLEQELGERIFQRTTRQVTLTPFGAHLLPLLEGLLTAEREIRLAADHWKRPGRRIIRIGFTPAVQLQPIHLALEVWHRDHADCEIVLKECLTEDLEQRLRAGTLDLALMVRTEGKPRDSLLLHQEPLLLLPRHGTRHQPRLKELAGETFVFTRGCGLADAVRHLFRRARVAIKEYPGQAISYRVIEEWADLGLGAGVLPRSKLSDHGAAAVPLQLADGRVASIRTYACWPKGSLEGSPERKFLAWLSARTPVIQAGVDNARSTSIRPETRRSTPAESSAARLR